MDIFLETDRLILRWFTAQDGDHLVDLDSDPAVMRHVNGGTPTPCAVIEQEVLPAFLSYHQRGDRCGFWAAIDRETGDFLGWFHLRPPDGVGPNEGTVELGYRLKAAAWGKGYATEGARALIAKGFAELGVRQVVAGTDADHTASRRVMEKVGMHLERTFLAPYPDMPDGPAVEAVEYVLTLADWQTRNSAS